MRQPLVTTTVQMTTEHHRMLQEMKQAVPALTLRALVEQQIERKYAKFSAKRMNIHSAPGPKQQPELVEQQWQELDKWAEQQDQAHKG